MKGNDFDVIVLGVGAMGSAAMWRLARRGVRVCGVEQYGTNHGLGSSHGESRAIRKAYFEHPDYVPLLNRAYELWDELEGASGRRLLVGCGMVFAGAPDSVAVRGLERCYAEHALPHARLGAAEGMLRFPEFMFQEHHVVFHDPLGGYVKPEAAIASMVALAKGAGAELVEHAPVVSWSADGTGICVEMHGRSLRAEKLIITAGAWSGPLLETLHLPLQIRRKVQLWYRAPQLERMLDMPVWYIDNAYGGVYGFPAIGGRFKVATHDGGEPTQDPKSLVRDLVTGDEALVLRCLAETFPWLTPELVKHAVCMYTCTPNNDFIIDQHPELDNVYFAAGFSGHGFKFAPVVGEVLADLATDGRSPLPYDFLRLQRLQGLAPG
jgi:sarcosine oxidase